MVEDHGNKEVATGSFDFNGGSLAIVAETSKHDPQGVLQEGINLRQNIVRFLASDQTNIEDPEMLKVLLKTQSDNDKTVLAMARISVEEKGQEGKMEQAKLIARAALNIASASKGNVVTDMVNEHIANFDLPESDKPFVNGEMDIGTCILTAEDVSQGSLEEQ